MAPVSADMRYEDFSTEKAAAALVISAIWVSISIITGCKFLYPVPNVSHYWPQIHRSRGTFILSCVLISLSALIWPITLPALGIATWCKVCGNKRKAKKEQKAQEVELKNMRRVQRMQEEERKRQFEQHQKWLEAEEARQRVKGRMDAVLGRTAPVPAPVPLGLEAGTLPAPPPPPVAAAPAHGPSVDAGGVDFQISEEMWNDANVRRTSDRDSNHTESSDGYDVLSPPLTMPSPTLRQDLTSSRSVGSSSRSTPMGTPKLDRRKKLWE